MNTENMKSLADRNCERMVVASLIATPYAIFDVEDILDENCFTDMACREIFKAAAAVNRKGGSVDLVSVSNELEMSKSGVGTPMLAEMVCLSPTTAELGARARLLRNLSQRREVLKIALAMASEIGSRDNDVIEVCDRNVQLLNRIFEPSGANVKNLSDAYSEVHDCMIENRDIPEGKIVGSPTGFDFIDRCGGLKSGDLIVVGAETSQGKTSFATALALSAVCAGHGVAFYSLEMSARELAARIASMQSGIPSSHILYKSLTQDKIDGVDRSMVSVDGAGLYFDVRSNANLDSIAASIRRMKMRRGIKGVVIDYLQLLHIKDARMSREQVVAQCARTLKNLARELDIWIILISQLSRDSHNPVPGMSRLRDSGQIEEAADMVLLIYRPAEGASFPPPFRDVPTVGRAMVIVGKGRNTGTGSFICGFRAVNTFFFPIAGDMLREPLPFRMEPDPASPRDYDLPF